jgi:hypothetical protein
VISECFRGLAVGSDISLFKDLTEVRRLYNPGSPQAVFIPAPTKDICCCFCCFCFLTRLYNGTILARLDFVQGDYGLLSIEIQRRHFTDDVGTLYPTGPKRPTTTINDRALSANGLSSPRRREPKRLKTHQPRAAISEVFAQSCRLIGPPQLEINQNGC